MYTITNQQRKEIIMLLATLQDLPASNDTKTYNTVRRARVLCKQLMRNNKPRKI